jgi:cytochrome o ubiquinol oxidase subunit 2
VGLLKPDINHNAGSEHVDMSKSNKLIIVGILLYIVGAVLVYTYLLHGHTIAVLQPQGHIAEREKALLLMATGLSLLVVIPVFALTLWITWTYRASNTKSRYSPDFNHSRPLETIWWLIPLCLIVILSVITWRSSHELDPFKSLSNTTKPLVIQVVALQWKWLFIYPEQQIASVNYARIPINTPVEFQITSDAPMNSFWLPQLGGQMYAMSGMSTQLHLVAQNTGVYHGSSANISGAGFADMKFITQATSLTDFKNWSNHVRNTNHVLTYGAYNQLAQPSSQPRLATYSAVAPNLYDTILLKYMPLGTQAIRPAGTQITGVRY